MSTAQTAFGGLVAVLVLAGLAAPVHGAQVSSQTRDDLVGPGWVFANLTWASGAGGIVFGPAPAGNALGGDAKGDPPTDTFTSGALGHALYLNPAHLVQADLLFQNPTGVGAAPVACSIFNPTKRISVTLHADDIYVAGAMTAWQMSRPLQPAAPDGFTLCDFRMPVETVFIPSGARLVLRVSFEGQPAAPIGVSEATPGLLRISTFTPEEATYRFPEVIPRVRDGSPAPPGALGSLTGHGGLGLAGLGLLALPLRVNRRALMATAVLGCLLLAGCAGSAKPADAVAHDDPGADEKSGADVRLEAPLDPGLANATSGSIVGRVSDRYGYPVPDASVALVSTPYAARSDANGLFSFRALRPGEYLLHIDREIYQSLEVKVRVAADKVSRVEAILAFDTSFSAAERPHPHDFWLGENETVLFSGPIYRECGAQAGCPLMYGFYVPPAGAKDFHLVRPGTSEVEVELEFDPAKACSDRLGFAIQENSDSSPHNWTFYAPRESGETFHVKTTWEMTDVGHQLYSTWSFGVYVDPVHAAACPASPTFVDRAVNGNPAIEGVTKATITLKRGTIPLEPAHPDHWKGRAALQLVKNSQVTDPRFADPSFAVAWHALCTADAQGVSGAGARDVRFADPLVVPVGSHQLTFYVNQSRANGIAGVASAWKWNLWYKTGATQPEPYRPGSPVYLPADAPEVSSDGRHWTWRIDVATTDVDGIYNKKSAWRFDLVPDDWQARCNDMAYQGSLPDAAAGGVTTGPLVMTNDVVVARGPE